jgi:hypothetical protein
MSGEREVVRTGIVLAIRESLLPNTLGDVMPTTLPSSYIPKLLDNLLLINSPSLHSKTPSHAKMHVNPQVESAILTGLESTSYACTELVPVSGGYVNFVYLGKLVSPLPTTPPTTQIIIKHAEPYVAANAAWPLPVARIVSGSSSQIHH